MSTYEPGTVAVATVRGEPNVRVMRSGSGWQSPDAWVSGKRVTDIRPLVVLDLDGIAAEAIVKALRDKDAGTNGTGWARVADQIEAQTKPPRIPEPGLWGVVEASWDSKQPAGIPRAEWMRTKGNQWRSCISAVAVRWDDLIDPTLVRPGIADGAS